MPSSRDLSAEIAFVGHLKSLVTAYEEIAVMRIDHVRQAVLQARGFREGLTSVFSRVRTTYQNEVAAAEQKHRAAKKDTHAVVLFSTNTRLSGRVTPDLVRFFLKYRRRQPRADLFIVGQVGKERFQAAQPHQPFVFFPLPATQPTAADLRPIVTELLQYATVTIVFPQFQNLVEQAPTAVTIGGEEPDPPPPPPTRFWRLHLSDQAATAYLFEPSLDDVVEFFEEQLFFILVEQTAAEAWLSLLGSRITAMETATQNIEQRVAQLDWDQRRAERKRNNRKQRDRLAGLSLWYT